MRNFASYQWFLSTYELTQSLSLADVIVNFVIASRVIGSKECTVPDLFSLNSQSIEQYEFFYFPEVDECFPANTLVVVEKALRPGPGLFLIRGKTEERPSVFTTAVRRDNGHQVTFDLPEDNIVLGRIRHMLYYRLD